jgi:hypothetical protein
MEISQYPSVASLTVMKEVRSNCGYMRDEENVSENINTNGTRCFSNRQLTAQTFQYADEGSSSSEKLLMYSRILSLVPV